MSGISRLHVFGLATLVVLLALCISYSSCGTITRFDRAIEDSTTDRRKLKTCHRSTPCGWEIYTPFTRRINHFMPNACVCGDGTVCVRTDDDLSTSAYVHRCREKKTNPESETDLQNVGST